MIGKDADEMYEDVGHSNEARKTMKKYIIGSLEVKIKIQSFIIRLLFVIRISFINLIKCYYRINYMTLLHLYIWALND